MPPLIDQTYTFSLWRIAGGVHSETAGADFSKWLGLIFLNGIFCLFGFPALHCESVLAHLL